MLLNVDWEERVNWERLRKYRIDRIVEQLKKKGLRAVMLSKLDTIRYATSFRGVYTWQFHGNRYIALITDEGHVSFFVGSGEYSKVRETMPWLTDVTPFPFVMEEGYDLVEAKLRELGITKGKVGVDMMKFAMIDKIQRGMPDLELVDGYSVVENAQLVKNPDEIVLLKANAQLADIGMTTMLDHLGEGVTEIECSAAAAHKLMMLGCEDVAYYPLCESGMHSWNTYKYPTTKRMQRGDMVWMDCVCLFSAATPATLPALRWWVRPQIYKSVSTALCTTCSGMQPRNSGPGETSTNPWRRPTAPQKSTDCRIRCISASWVTGLEQTCILRLHWATARSRAL